MIKFEIHRKIWRGVNLGKCWKNVKIIGFLLPSYRGITLFPALCKIYEMVLLNKLEKFAADRGYFSELQFGFREGVGCIEASFTILETINHMLERGSKVFCCFLDVRKAFDTVWIDGLLYKLFNDFALKAECGWQ